jgi:hypothetical protein
MDLFTAGLWISRLSLLAMLVLLAGYARQIGVGGRRHAVVAAYLAFPSAFILVSVYTEALFVALTLGAFVAARGERRLVSGILACLAVLTRIHGLALAPALVVMGWQQGNGGGGRLSRYAPTVGAMVGTMLVAFTFQVIFDDPLAFNTAKRENWGSELTWPWDTIGNAITRAERALTRSDLGSIYTLLELPCLYLILVSIVVLGARRLWPEAAFVAASASLSLASGTLWGVPRFSLVLFPMFFVLATLRRRRAAWHFYLIGASVLQACVLVVYVSFRNPPP